MKQTVNLKWASQPPRYIEPADEFPYFWVSAENDGLLDFIEVWNGNFWHKEKPDQLCCHSLNHGDMYLADYIAMMHEDYDKLLWLQTECSLMPGETGVFDGPANEWYPYMDEQIPKMKQVGNNNVQIQTHNGDIYI